MGTQVVGELGMGLKFVPMHTSTSDERSYHGRLGFGSQLIGLR